MLIVFVSNTYNHHQSSLSDAFFSITGGNYYFIETKRMSKERLSLGWQVNNTPEYVKKSYESNKMKKECIDLINKADVVIIGSASEYYIKKRKKEKKLIFRYSERIYKKKNMYLQLPLRIIKYYLENNKQIYLLCASAYAAYDYNLSRCFIGKTFKWGYFPKTIFYSDTTTLLDKKKKNSILWVSRFIEWKHPEDAIKIAQLLKNSGYDFKLTMIGTGDLLDDTKKMVYDKGLKDYVNVMGAMSPTEVRTYMEKSEIFIYTADYAEGWGAVLNESMNSCCAVIASHAIGAVPYLINDNENGLLYKNGNIDSLYKKTVFLLDNPEKRKSMSVHAYDTITKIWNAQNAATNFIMLAEKCLNNESEDDLFEKGPCSKAIVMKNNWYK